MALRVLHTQTSRGFSWRITTQVRGHGGEDSVERDVDLEFRRPGETYWHPAESYREETGRDIPSRVVREYESNARAFADRPRTAHGRPWKPSVRDLLGMLEHRRNPMTLSVKGRRVRVHSLGKGIRFPQRAWPSEAAILAHSLKQAKRIHRTYGEAWKNPTRRMSKRQALRRERLKWRSLSKAERKRIHREETVEVRDIWRNPRRRGRKSRR